MEQVDMDQVHYGIYEYGMIGEQNFKSDKNRQTGQHI